VAGVFRTCTLLGPEGPDRPSGCFDSRTLFLSARWGGWGRDRPYFENYTVDASILDSDSLCEGLSLLDLNFFWIIGQSAPGRPCGVGGVLIDSFKLM